MGLQHMWNPWAQPPLRRGCGIPPQMYLSWPPRAGRGAQGQEEIRGGASAGSRWISLPRERAPFMPKQLGVLGT